VGARGRPPRRKTRRDRVLTRTLPLALLVLVALIAGLIIVTGSGADERHLVTRYVQALEHGDYPLMYSLLDRASQARESEAQFAAANEADQSTATATKLVMRRIDDASGNEMAVVMTVQTRLFGRLREVLLVPLSGSGSDARVHFANELLFPGLRPGEVLNRITTLPARGDLLASDGTPLAKGPARTSPIPDVAGEIVGTLGSVPADQRASYIAAGYPPDAKVGLDGLEHVFQTQLAGIPGGTLLAGRRVLAHTAPVPGTTVTTTIVPALERAAVAAEAGRYAGIAAMDPRTGAVLALAGIAFSALQPPGSTMKIVTVTGALEAGIVKLGTTFPIQTSANLDGFNLQNAGGEACGGTLLNAFAVSCNSVFAPLGAKLGAQRLVNIAERFGFNQPSSIPGAAVPEIPPASTMPDTLTVGSSAIGQGKVLSSALGMTDVAATIAMGGTRPIPTLQAGQTPRFVKVTSSQVAGEVQRMMIAVVQFGTGTAAQITGVTVAGKTGTAELGNTANPNNPNAETASNTDAWFVGYAPVGAPRIVVGALFPEQGAGGATAAPAVHDVLVAALARH
jgi:peptidoglycan glycosyltransferase